MDLETREPITGRITRQRWRPIAAAVMATTLGIAACGDNAPKTQIVPTAEAGTLEAETSPADGPERNKAPEAYRLQGFSADAAERWSGGTAAAERIKAPEAYRLQGFSADAAERWSDGSPLE